MGKVFTVNIFLEMPSQSSKRSLNLSIRQVDLFFYNMLTLDPRV